MSESLPDFGFGHDEDGCIQFMTVRTEFVPTNFQEYMGWFVALVQIAENNPGYMPIATFPKIPPYSEEGKGSE